ncbi:ABC transporter permease [Mycolicibacterium brisbanense]|uniref:ABC transporter permease n=1 Tax=Mycolicibacterium brisbanense TaxID=146020 RepID=UPI000493BFA1|nr:ABC transporter permease [Mycolicibacterium brisbanense]MCV7159183.1 ABC transporter permease [Mycolicibacterium brisbanense]
MRYVGFVLKRLAFAAVTAAVASFLVYAAMYFSPTSSLSLLLGGRNVSPEQIARVRQQYHLDEGLLGQYWHWLSSSLRGDFGTSFLYRDSVSSLLGNHLTTTAFLVVYAGILILTIGVSTGALAALRSGWLDGVLRFCYSAGIAIPAFVAATVLISTFAVQFPIFPAYGSGSDFGSRLYSLTLPAIALALSNVAYIGKVTRASINQTKSLDFVWAASARGIRRRTVTMRHTIRNGLLPVVTVGGLSIAGLIAGTVVVETAFGLDGIGSLLVQAISQNDFALAQAIVLILIVVFILLSTVVDIIYGLLDPRIAEGLVAS